MALTRPYDAADADPDDIIDGGLPVIYIGWIFAGIPFIFLWPTWWRLSCVPAGDSKTPLYFLILTSALNIGLDLLFVIPFKFSVFGAGASDRHFPGHFRALSFIYSAASLMSSRCRRTTFAFRQKACMRLMGIGVPMGPQCSITAIGSVIVQWAVNMLEEYRRSRRHRFSYKTQNLLTVPLEASARLWRPTPGREQAHPMDRVPIGYQQRYGALIILVYGLVSAFIPLYRMCRLWACSWIPPRKRLSSLWAVSKFLF